MAIERTLSIIKPDGTRRNITGEIINQFEKNGLKVVAQKKIKMTKEMAEHFYAEHKERPFFESLVTFMSSYPVVVQVLEGESAIERNREIMGATNPAEAKVGTIRKMFGLSIQDNTVHGSDSVASAQREIAFFFSNLEIFDL